ncbi:ABC transporter permease subunit [Agrobacterium vitis]|uniref:ABC transporter membrane spanning protein (Maltose) n=2 Tax=Rhizobium/Agrobacterium group TaxID=227290 RepID=B9K2W4_ALLAM|nr:MULTISPECIES: sugar ABC transporter permease [Rhizobium/Agrobacterium group]MCF1498975.1 sugar ABC transporter permease [Allorhizobium sp. Av2]ACM39212.1 ABC transporter membrane spanning protein (maltose) [Allorhizobium ampelinum S4]MBF2713062.1 sugar ABC transporter permease [Agrobacterium vitis]MCF1432366.1 sugar ABC transporter permease [Allorhizobium ampelinum]MCF1445315.1 sugar ABC transporter permease [Allorhizobium ampelinum]
MEAKRRAVFFAWCLLLPATIYIAIIVAYPLVDTFILSFTDASLKRVTNWVGWDNYNKIFNATFADVIIRTFVWTFFSVLFKMIIGTFGATLLNTAVPGRTLFRILTMPPWIVPMAIGIFMWGWMYNGQFGMISGMLQRVGLVDGPVAFLAYGSTAFWATIFTDVWIGVPMVTLYLLAAMQAIPQDLHEAAWTDGAGRFYRFRRITLPLLMPAMITMSMISLISTFNSFDIIWILTRGGPSGGTTTMIIDTYKTAIGSYKYGEGAARAVLICIFLSIFSYFYFRVTSRLSQEHSR